jgi:uncharacterized protein (TIGR03083 family)
VDTEERWTHITAERRAVAELLGGLAEEQWAVPSLCSRWTVRDVAAHLVLVSRPPSARELAVRAVRARGSFHRLNERAAKDNARHPTDQLVRWLRDDAGSRRLPAVTNEQNVLFDVLVHTQDIAVPLGISHKADPRAAVAGAARVWAMGWPFHARRRMRGLRLVAADTEWSAGDGLEVEGPASALLLALTGRPAALPDLHGPGTDRLATVLGS